MHDTPDRCNSAENVRERERKEKEQQRIIG
jgi:hypothetical protein